MLFWVFYNVCCFRPMVNVIETYIRTKSTDPYE